MTESEKEDVHNEEPGNPLVNCCTVPGDFLEVCQAAAVVVLFSRGSYAATLNPEHFCEEEATYMQSQADLHKRFQEASTACATGTEASTAKVI